MLNPRFMEQLRKVEQLVDGHFCLGIMNHKLHVIFDTRSNSLEPEVLKEITHEEIDKIKESLQYIVDMIEIFELDK